MLPQFGKRLLCLTRDAKTGRAERDDEPKSWEWLIECALRNSCKTNITMVSGIVIMVSPMTGNISERLAPRGVQSVVLFSILERSRIGKMVSTELEAAKAAKAAIDTLSTITPKSSISATLRKANTAAVLNLGRGGALNKARINVGIALSNLIDGSPTAERVYSAKSAIDVWIKKLEAATPWCVP